MTKNLKLVTGKTENQIEKTFSGLEKIYEILKNQKPETFDFLDNETQSELMGILLFETDAIDIDSQRFGKFKRELFGHFVNRANITPISPRDYWKTCDRLRKEINSILESIVNIWIEQNIG